MLSTAECMASCGSPMSTVRMQTCPKLMAPSVEPLRALAYEDIDAAMALGLKMSLEELKAGGIVPHSATVEALRWYGTDRT